MEASRLSAGEREARALLAAASARVDASRSRVQDLADELAELDKDDGRSAFRSFFSRLRPGGGTVVAAERSRQGQQREVLKAMHEQALVELKFAEAAFRRATGHLHSTQAQVSTGLGSRQGSCESFDHSP